MTRRILVLSGLWLLLAIGTAPLAGQTTGGTRQPLVIGSMYGQDLFAFYCVSCHGPTGKGDGPMAHALNVAPPDLTRLSERHGGSYPAAYVEQVLLNGCLLSNRSHGSSDMPVWGPIFQALETSDTRVRVRLANLVAHLESLQSK